MTIRDTDTARIANLRAALASVSAKAEKALDEVKDTNERPIAHQALICGLALTVIRKACEDALKADERAGGKPTQ